ncbi:MAG TPA: peroxiredoxin [Gammaproteobacteria bacterium]|nr:peroxiredoxin [Gammaproteobacteria bacterium]
MTTKPCYLPGLIAGACLFGSGAWAAETPQVGEPAPEFELRDQTGAWRSLDDYGGQWLALYFYPKDDTPGCTTEACAFRDNIYAFRELGAEIVGISLDDVDSHRQFAEKYHLPFTLLSDPEGKTALKYGVLKKLGPVSFARRESFLIDPHGKVARHYADVDPERHSQEVLADLAVLTGAAADGG